MLRHVNGNVVDGNGIWPATLSSERACVGRHASGCYGIEPARSTASDRRLISGLVRREAGCMNGHRRSYNARLRREGLGARPAA